MTDGSDFFSEKPGFTLGVWALSLHLVLGLRWVQQGRRVEVLVGRRAVRLEPQGSSHSSGNWA